MLDHVKDRPDLPLLLSVLLIILVYPVLDQGEIRRMILGLLVFILILATFRLSAVKAWVWPRVAADVRRVFLLGSEYDSSRTTLTGIEWAFLTVFFGLTVSGLFSYLKNARTISDSHLYTPISIYLLLGLLWSALYGAIDAFYPGAILRNHATLTDRSSELQYFSLVTLSTIGYGDVVPIGGKVRMLAALEGITGVLYTAITSGYPGGSLPDAQPWGQSRIPKANKVSTNRNRRTDDEEFLQRNIKQLGARCRCRDRIPVCPGRSSGSCPEPADAR